MHILFCRGVGLGKKSVLLRISEEEYNQIHELMGYKLVSEDKQIVLERMHIGSNQDFYRTLIQRGIGILKQEWEEKKKKYESQDSD